MRFHSAMFVAIVVTAQDVCLSANAQGPHDRAEGLLIIAPDAFIESLQPYAAARGRDLPTRLVPLSAALEQGAAAHIAGHAQPAVDDAERLKRFLYVEWRDQQIRFALLVGDADVMPVRYMCLDRVHEPAFDYAFYPSDLYYADVAKADGSFDDWNASREGVHATYFGEVRGEKNKNDAMNFDQVDYAPEMAVGRWPVSASTDAAAVAGKTLRHLEAASSAGNHRHSQPKAGLVACGGWIENRPAMDELAAKLQEAKWSIARHYFADERRNDGTPGVDADSIIALVNGGCDLIVHSGHGNDDRWEHSISVTSIARMTGLEDRLPVLMSAGCSTARLATLPPYEGYIDMDGKRHAGTNNGQVFTGPPPAPACYQTGEFNPSGLGEALLRAPEGGAVAYIGCNTGSQPCGMTLARGLAIALAERDVGKCRLGACWNQAIRHYIAAENLENLVPIEGQWYPASIFFQGMKFMLFGDPSIPLGPDSGS